MAECHPLPQACPADPTIPRDLRTLAQFIRIYCRHKHPDAPKREPSFRGFDMEALRIRRLELCGSCAKLLGHAFVKRAHCPFNPKPACKHCQSHCYQPLYREQIREVMRFSGRKLVLSGRLDLLFKLLY
jgi:hypothetical protein